MSIRDWPIDDRSREKLLKLGPQALSEAELIAIFLRTGIRGRSALDVARDLLSSFGSVRGLLTAERQTLCKAPGMGVARYATLQAVLELARRHFLLNTLQTTGWPEGGYPNANESNKNGSLIGIDVAAKMRDRWR